MASETTKPTNSSVEGEKQKQFNREVRDMVSAITNRLGDLHKAGVTHHEEEDENGVKIVTLAGSNTGATMRSELDEKSNPPHGVSVGEHEAFNTFVNSNFQAVNNSIMMGSHYNTNDPGVHLDISDFLDEHGHKPDKHEKKGKKKDKGAFKSDQHSDHSV